MSSSDAGLGRLRASAEHHSHLLRRMAKGDSGALAALYDNLAPLILGMLVRLLRSRPLAEDVLQDTFSHAWRYADGYRPEAGSPCSWLLAIARSLGIVCFRREAARKATLDWTACSSIVSLPFLGHRILIVDHDSDFLETFGTLLKSLGAQVYQATSAGMALEDLITRRPDLLISDLRMAGMDGFGLVEAIRSLPESLGGRTPAIALSGAPVSQVVPRVLNSGFQIFLQKPLNENELLFAVPELVGRACTEVASSLVAAS